MKTYLERATDAAAGSTIAVMVLLNPDNTDMEFWQLKPRRISDTPPHDVVERQLRIVGVIALQGIEPHVVFKEPIDSRTVNAIAGAFLEYVRVLLGNQFTAQLDAEVIAELERLYSLPDTRNA